VIDFNECILNNPKKLEWHCVIVCFVIQLRTHNNVWLFLNNRLFN
jgi:hypothetical protein